MTTTKRKTLDELMAITEIPGNPPTPVLNAMKQMMKEALDELRRDMPEVSELEETIFATGFLAGMNAIVIRCLPTTTEKIN